MLCYVMSTYEGKDIMKKILILISVFLLSISLVGCNTSGDSKSDNSTTTSKKETTKSDTVKISEEIKGLSKSRVKEIEKNLKSAGIVTENNSMEAEDPSYPMPEGSVDGIFEMVISGNSFMSFPSMSYTEPGIYTYTIEQIAGLNPLCAYDPSVYHLKVSVTNAQDGSGLTAMVALRSEDADEKLAEAMFTNRYGTSPVPRDSNPPKTGDESNILLYGYLALVSIAGLVVSVVIQKRGKRRSS